jgi:hypothetical protein
MCSCRTYTIVQVNVADIVKDLAFVIYLAMADVTTKDLAVFLVQGHTILLGTGVVDRRLLSILIDIWHTLHGHRYTCPVRKPGRTQEKGTRERYNYARQLYKSDEKKA